MRHLRLAGLLGLALLVPGRLYAQATPESLNSGVSVKLLQAPSNGVDESALRYLAQHNDRAGVAAEIARLKSLYPDWQPPTDLFTPPSRVDESPLWALYDKRDFAGVRAMIQQLSAQNPGWQPPQRLLSLMSTQEERAKLGQAAAAKDWAAVVRQANGHVPSSCDVIDNGWIVAEALARTGHVDDASAAYRQIVQGCDHAELRYATLQKAKVTLPEPAFRTLVDASAGLVGDAALAGRIRALAETPAAASGPVAAGAARAAPPMPAALTALYRPGAGIREASAAAPLVEAKRDAAGARKIGWIYYTAKQPEAAIHWFEQAQGWAPNADAVRGLALSLSAAGRFDELRALAARQPSVAAIAKEAQAGELGQAFARQDYAAVLQASAGATTAGPLLLRGWSLLSLARPTEAEAAFRRALAAGGMTPAQTEEGYYGIARSRIAYGDMEAGIALGERLVLHPDWQRQLRLEGLADAAYRAFQIGAYRQALDLYQRRRTMAPPDRNLQIQEAWTFYHLGRFNDAKRLFTQLDQTMSTAETREGLKVVDERSSRIGGL